ncbi:hypothetical protein CUMW_268820 [Citrus unshiu]|uniref:non-specific serine/threonine protein kinase n=1 Tax=Citrus unshiu TaxID=55188 RepID=A0A2H5QWN0_CITUN|nr:hypothetical protein CUMW_268820 [Citrus unshiu]
MPYPICNVESLERLDLSHGNLSGSFQIALKECMACHSLTVKGLQACKALRSYKHSSRAKWIIILFPLLGSDSERQSSQQNLQGLLLILNFEGKIMCDEIIKATKDFDAEFCIRNGGHGNVYRDELPFGEIIAVTTFHSPLPRDRVADHKEFLTEVEALIEMRHRNIVKFYGFC